MNVRREVLSKSLDNVQIEGEVTNGDKKKMTGNILTNILHRKIKTHKEMQAMINHSRINLENSYKGSLSTISLRRQDPCDDNPQPPGQFNPDPPKDPKGHPKLPPKPPVLRHKTQPTSAPEYHPSVPAGPLVSTSTTSSVHSRTSSQSSGFEEDVSVGEGTSWKDNRSIADLVSSYILPVGATTSTATTTTTETPGKGGVVRHPKESSSEIDTSRVTGRVPVSSEIDTSQVTGRLLVHNKVTVTSNPGDNEDTSRLSSPDRDSGDDVSMTSYDAVAKANVTSAEERLFCGRSFQDGGPGDLSADNRLQLNPDAKRPPILTSPTTNNSEGTYDVTTTGPLSNDYVISGAISRRPISCSDSCSEVLTRRVHPGSPDPIMPLRPELFSPQPFKLSRESTTAGSGTGKRKGVSFIAGDDDFCHYRLKPPGFETHLVLPFTEQQQQQRKPEARGGTGSRDPLPLLKPPVPAKTWKHRLTSDDLAAPAPTRNPGLIRRHSERISDRNGTDIFRRPGKRDVITNDVITNDVITNDVITNDVIEDDDLDSSRVQDAPSKFSFENCDIVTSIVKPEEESSASGTTVSFERAPRTENKNREIDGERTQGGASAYVTGSSSSSSAAPSGDRESLWGSPKQRKSTPEVTSSSRLQRRHQPRFQSDSSLADVTTALELAKKIEDFNRRLAAMATVATTTSASSSSSSKMASKNSDNNQRKSSAAGSGGEVGADHVTGGVSGEDVGWKNGRFPLVERLLSESWDETGSNPGRPGDALRRAEKNEFPADPWDDTEGGGGGEVPLVGTRAIQQVATAAAPAIVPSRFGSVNCASRSMSELWDNRDDDDVIIPETGSRSKWQPSRVTSCGDLDSLERMKDGQEEEEEVEDGTSGVSRRPFPSRRDTGSGDLRNRKSLQTQAAELQTQFSRWHRQLIQDRSGALFHRESGETPEQPRRHESELLPVPPPTGTGSDHGRAFHLRSNDFRFSWDLESQLKEYLDEIPTRNSSGSPVRPRKSVQRSASCVHDVIPRTAMAKFNVDGTPRSILKRLEAPKSLGDNNNNNSNNNNNNQVRRNDRESDNAKIVDDKVPYKTSFPDLHDNDDDDKDNHIQTAQPHTPSPPTSSSSSSRSVTFPPNSPSKRSTAEVTSGSSPVGSASRGSSPASRGSAAADWGSSKFTGLQNLHRRTALMKMRSQSDLGSPASILDALRQA